MSGAEAPLVSVLLSAYNAGPDLLEAIESVRRQTLDAWELFVIDDGSTDGSVAAARRRFDDPRIRWLHQENSGKSVALNRALQQIRGRYFAIQDADDASHPGRCALQAACLDAHPELGAVFCGHELILDGRRLAPRSRPKDAAECAADIDAFRMPAHDPTGMFRADLVPEILFEESLAIGQGFDYILRVGERYPLQVLGECLYSYRVSRPSITTRDPARRERMVERVLRRACERRGLDFEEHFRSRASVAGRRSRDNNLAAHFMESALDQRRRGQFWGALRTALSCARLAPFSPHYYKPCVFAVLPPRLTDRIRRSRPARVAVVAGGA